VNQKPQKKTNPAPKPYEDRPVGCPPYPDLSAMTKEELKARCATVGRLKELLSKTEKGTKKAVPEIREILRDNPDLAWRFIDLAKVTEWHPMDRISKDEDLATRETLTQQFAVMRTEIAGEDPSPFERLLAERLVATWLQIQVFESLYASSLYENITIAQGNYHQKRLDQTYRRHLAAIRTLVQIRKLGPAVQINIAQKQINTAGIT
jgi:hypothetical protein